MNDHIVNDDFLVDEGENDGYPTPHRSPLLHNLRDSSSPRNLGSFNMVSSLNSSINSLNEGKVDQSNLSGKIVQDFLMLFDQANGCFNGKETRFIPNESSLHQIVRTQKATDYVGEVMYDTSAGRPCYEAYCDDACDVSSSLDEQFIYPSEDFAVEVQNANNLPLQQTDFTFEPYIKPQHDVTSPFDSESNPEKDDLNPRLNIKRPFLRKGSRREPSALSRVGSSKNGQNSADIGDEASHLEKLQELEKMQRDQIAQLEHRISIRAEARKAIIKQNMQKNPSQSVNTIKKADEIHSKDSSQSGNTTKKADKNHSIPKPSTTVAICSRPKGLQKKSPLQVCGLEDELRPPLKHNRSLSSSVKEEKDKPQDQTPTQETVEIQSSKKDVDEDDDQVRSKDQWEEQWQVIKCMRKRQEVALRDAERDREEARRWATNERDTVQKWVDQQKFFLKREKERLANSAMAVDRKKKLDLLEEKASAAVESNHKRTRDEIEALKAEIHKLKIDSDAWKSRARLSDKRLRDIISDKDAKLHASKEEIVYLQERNKDLTEKLEDYSRKVTSLKRRLSQSVKTADGARCNHDIQVDLSQCQIYERCSQSIELNKEGYDSNSHECNKSDEWTKNIEFLGNTQMKETNVLNESETDSTALRALSQYPDLLEEPTECWLQKHLERLHEQSIRNNTELNRDPSAKDPIETAIDELPDACTPIRPAPKIDQDSPDACLTKISSATSIESQNYSTPSKTKSLHSNHKETSVLPNNRRIVRYQNGTEKETAADGTTTIIRYTNGDVKTSYTNAGVIVYYYASSKTSHTTHPDGMEIYEFSNGQVEKHFKSGRKEITFPDGTRKTMLPDGNKETVFPDGITVVEFNDGRKEIIRR